LEGFKEACNKQHNYCNSEYVFPRWENNRKQNNKEDNIHDSSAVIIKPVGIGSIIVLHCKPGNSSYHQEDK